MARSKKAKPRDADARPLGRPRNDRLRAMRFALWAQHIPPHLLTWRQIAGALDLHKTAASDWRRDWLKAISPVDVDGVPKFLTIDPRELPALKKPAATGDAAETTRS